MAIAPPVNWTAHDAFNYRSFLQRPTVGGAQLQVAEVGFPVFPDPITMPHVNPAHAFIQFPALPGLSNNARQKAWKAKAYDLANAANAHVPNVQY